MEIKERIEIENKNRKLEVEAIIDTGAEVSVIDEEILLKLGAKHLGNLEMITAGEPVGLKSFYFLPFMKIRKCRVPIFVVIGGKKNLIGHDILQRMNAKIDEGAGTVEFPECDKNYVEV